MAEEEKDAVGSGLEDKNFGLSFFEQLRGWAKQVDKIVPELREATERPPTSRYRTLPPEQLAVPTLLGFSDELQGLKQKCTDDYNQLFETTQDFDEFLENSQDKLKAYERRLNSCRVHLLKYGLKPMPVDKNERKMPVTPRNLVCDSTPLPQPPPTREITKTPELTDYGFSTYSVGLLLSSQKAVPSLGLTMSTAVDDKKVSTKNSMNMGTSMNRQVQKNTPFTSDAFTTPEQFRHLGNTKTKLKFKDEIHTPMENIFESLDDTLPDTPEITSSLATMSIFDKGIVEVDCNRLVTPELVSVPQQATPEEPTLTSNSKPNPAELVGLTSAVPEDHVRNNKKAVPATPCSHLNMTDELPPTPELSVQYRWLDKQK